MHRLAALLVVLVLTTACATTQPQPAARAQCNAVPQWTTQDAQGRPVGIYVCFGPEQRLLYTVRLLPPAPATPTPPALTPEEQHFLELGRAEVARLKAHHAKAQPTAGARQ
ncbi:MAG: hypothetical protein PHS14_00350 [Elusimicrobia bacterium]|nr:hypothetical protein [Elusimicrobiota bacterium]